MGKQLIIELTDEQYKAIRRHLTKQGEINQKEETFSGYSFILACTEFGISWLEVEMNSTIKVGDVTWSFVE